MPETNKDMAKIIDRLFAAKLSISARDVYLALYRLSVLEGQQKTNPVTVSSLGKKINKSPSTVSKAIDKLRKSGWLVSDRPGNRGCIYETMLPEPLRRIRFRRRIKNVTKEF